MSDLIVDFPHQRRSYIEPRDVIKKAVRFSPLAEVRFFYKGYDEPDASDQYFTKDEYKAFQMATQIAAQKAYLRHAAIPSGEEAKFQELEENSDLTGLESVFTPDICKQVLQRKKAVREAVFKEQRRQKELGYYDPEKLARVSQNLSAPGVYQALWMRSHDFPRSNKYVTKAARSA